MDLIEKTTSIVKFTPERVLEAEKEMLEMPQAKCDVIHHFGPGLYIRELHMSAGTFAIGHEQLHEHMNIVLKGKVRMVLDDGSFKDVEAPATFVGKPGKKVGYVLEDVIWQNVYATNETDVEKCEEMFLKKSDVFRQTHLLLGYEHDQADYLKVLDEYGFTEDVVQSQVHNKDDQMEMPIGTWKFRRSKSMIHGYGMVATSDIIAGEHIGPGRINGYRTPLGRWINHSSNPNAQFFMLDNGDIALIAIRDINGCRGGQDGEEITVNYRVMLEQFKTSQEVGK